MNRFSPAPADRPKATLATVVFLCALGVSCSLPGLNEEAFQQKGPLSIAHDSATLHVSVSEEVHLRMLARGGQPPYSWQAQDLPSGLSINPTTGLVSGASISETVREVTIIATDATGQTERSKVGLNVWSRPEILNGWLASGQTQERGEWRLTQSGGRQPSQWSVAGLPAGLELDSARGVIFGTPRLPGNHALIARVVDANGASDHRALVLKISPSTRTLMARVKLVGESTQDLAGFSVAGVGDVNNDGHGDVIIGAVAKGRDESNAPTSARGGAYLAYGPIQANVKLLHSTLRLEGETHGDNAGFSVAGGGDINGDGDLDILIGAPNKSAGSAHTGMAYLLNGPIGRPRTFSKPTLS